MGKGRPRLFILRSEGEWKPVKFERIVLVLTAVTLLVMTGWFLVRQQDASGQWKVTVQRNDSPAGSVSQEDGWPDSLLVGEAININTASASDLQRLPGIGPERARAIVEDRQERGGFSSVDELLRVDGIGPGILNGLRPYISAEG